MARMFRKLAVLATAAEAARRYAKANPDKAGKYVDQAAAFVDKQTKGRYSGQISGVAQKAKGVAGIPGSGHPHTGAPGTNGHSSGPAFDGSDAPTEQYRQTPRPGA